MAVYNPNENIVLADCGIGDVPGHPDWSTSRQVLYYKGAVWTDDSGSATNRPDMVSEVKWDGSYPWRIQSVLVPMPNGDKFFIIIKKPSLADGAGQAGDAFHDYDPTWLNCYAWHKKFVHQLPNGQWCGSAFVCNHQSGPVSQTRIEVKVSTNKDSATLDTHVSVDDVFDKISYNVGSQVCEEGWADISGTGCKISARCHGNVAGITPAMVKGLKDLARSADSGMFTQTTVRDKTYNPCKTGRDTCIGGWDWYDRKVTKVARTISVYVSDQNGNDKGELSYELDCSLAKSCEGCSAAKFGGAVASWLAGAAFGPVFGPLASIVATGACAASGC